MEYGGEVQSTKYNKMGRDSIKWGGVQSTKINKMGKGYNRWKSIRGTFSIR